MLQRACRVGVQEDLDLLAVQTQSAMQLRTVLLPPQFADLTLGFEGSARGDAPGPASCWARAAAWRRGRCPPAPAGRVKNLRIPRKQCLTDGHCRVARVSPPLARTSHEPPMADPAWHACVGPITSQENCVAMEEDQIHRRHLQTDVEALLVVGRLLRLRVQRLIAHRRVAPAPHQEWFNMNGRFRCQVLNGGGCLLWMGGHSPATHDPTL